MTGPAVGWLLLICSPTCGNSPEVLSVCGSHRRARLPCRIYQSISGRYNLRRSPCGPLHWRPGFPGQGTPPEAGFPVNRSLLSDFEFRYLNASRASLGHRNPGSNRISNKYNQLLLVCNRNTGARRHN